MYIFDKIVRNCENTFQDLKNSLKSKGGVRNPKKMLKKYLTLNDFEYIVTNRDEHWGYYSYKNSFYELCIDREYTKWNVYLCNKFEEVIQEHTFYTRARALRKVNEIYRSFKTEEDIRKYDVD